MKVRSADLYRLIEESWDKLHGEYGENFKSMNQNFFDSLASYIQKDSLNKYGVIFFRNQNLDSKSYVSFAKKLGKIADYPMLKGLSSKFPEITVVGIGNEC